MQLKQFDISHKINLNEICSKYIFLNFFWQPIDANTDHLTDPGSNIFFSIYSFHSLC